MPKETELIPILATNDVEGLKTFLTEKLGFTDGWVWEETGTYGGAHFDGKRIHFVKAITPGPDTPGVYIWVENADALYSRFQQAGVQLGDIGDRPYGMRDFEVKCPGGTILSFASEL